MGEPAGGWPGWGGPSGRQPRAHAAAALPAPRAARPRRPADGRAGAATSQPLRQSGRHELRVGVASLASGGIVNGPAGLRVGARARVAGAGDRRDYGGVEGELGPCHSGRPLATTSMRRPPVTGPGHSCQRPGHCGRHGLRPHGTPSRRPIRAAAHASRAPQKQRTRCSGLPERPGASCSTTPSWVGATVRARAE